MDFCEKDKPPIFGERITNSKEQIYEIRMRPDGAFEYTGRVLKSKVKTNE